MKSFKMSLFFAAIFYVTSCSEKEFVVIEDQSTMDVADSDLKSWFINSVLQNKQSRLVSQNNKELKLYFDWNKSLKQKRNDKSEGIIVPIFEFEDASIDEAKFKKVETRAYLFRKFPRSIKVLYLNKDLKGKNTYQIITYIPIKGATLSDYSGYTIFSDIKGNFLSGVVVKNNKVVGNVTVTKKQKNLRVNCGSWETVEWSYWYIDGEGTFTIVHGSDTWFNDSACGNTPQQDQGAPTNPNEGGGDSSSGGDNSGGFDLQSTNETLSEETVYDDGQTRNKIYKWVFLQGGNADLHNLYSREYATLVKAKVAPFGEIWTFSNVQHIDTGVDGQTAGVNFSIETAIATIENFQTRATVALFYNVKKSAHFYGIPLPVTDNYVGNQFKNLYPN